jgi:hypothetical protein
VEKLQSGERSLEFNVDAVMSVAPADVSKALLRHAIKAQAQRTFAKLVANKVSDGEIAKAFKTWLPRIPGQRKSPLDKVLGSVQKLTPEQKKMLLEELKR